jgi:predicted  nucleic acid-binding Zn-ribbon protein
MPKLFECIRCGATFERMLMNTPELCSNCARRHEAERVAERAAEEKEDRQILIEGPAWGDAEFYGNWLINADKANKLLQQARRDDPDFNSSVDVLEVLQCLDFGIMATVFVSKFVDKKFHTFTLDSESADLLDFVLMVEMGFFTLTGDRYQMTLPTKLDIDLVKQAHLKLVGTRDEDWIHPERLVVDVPRTRAIEFQRFLGDMDQGQRLADRRALLFLDS